MANKEHLDILKQGVEVWNRWREENQIGLSDFKDADLHGVNLQDADLHHAILIGANLSGATLNNANLKRAFLVNADLSNAVLSNANLTEATLTDAILRQALLLSTRFNYTRLLNTDFTGAVFVDTILANINLAEAVGLEMARHMGASDINIKTLAQSGGDIPEKFLRGCGVPEEFIAFSKSLVGKAIDFYSCFISFTEADDGFSERLHNDLQAAGVRCWRWKEDAKWGKTLMRSIDEAVRVYDKLVIICSEQSLQSPAVIREIERALQKEDDLARQGKEPEVLFPIRLDDYIFTGWQHYRKADVTQKNVGDFRNWQEPDKYRKQLERLIRDLNTKG